MLDFGLSIVWLDNNISRVELLPRGRLFSEHPKIQQWIDAYLSKKPIPFPLPLDLNRLTPFTQKVLLEIQKIPYGHTKTYKEVAEAIGHPGAQRAVGSACGRNPYPLFIPCHRVVGYNNMGGYSCAQSIKMLLYTLECTK